MGEEEKKNGQLGWNGIMTFLIRWKCRSRAVNASDPSSNTDESILTRDKVPLRVWLAAGVGMTERSAYYSSFVMIQNYAQNAASEKSQPGILGLGQAAATQIQFAFAVMMSLTPIAGALLADSRWGRYRTVLYSFPFLIAGLLLISAISFNITIGQSAGAGPLLISLLLISVGSGGIKSNISAFIGDQYVPDSSQPRRNRNSQMVQSDQALTLEHIYSVYFWMINIGSLAGIITTVLEKKIGFGFAFLLPLACAVLGLVILLISSRIFIKHGPSKGNLTRTFAYARRYIRARLRESKANMRSDDPHEPDIDETFSQAMADTWKACRIFSTFTIAWLCWDQAGNNFISQAGQMNTYGVPNDMLFFINPVMVIILLPCMEKGIYPLMRARGVKLGSLTRIFIGFIILTISMVYASALQAIIYSRGPCYNHPRTCAKSEDGSLPNDISAFAQIPLYTLQAIAEIFSQIAATEYAFSQAPEGMKSVMQAISQVSNSVGALLGIAIAPASRNPWLVAVYACLAGAMAITTGIFRFLFGGEDA